MSGRTYEDGRRNATRACIEWLHQRAREMNDPHAKAILNTAAFHLGVDFSQRNQPMLSDDQLERLAEIGADRGWRSE